MNKYLEKIAEASQPDNSLGNAILVGGGGAAAYHSVPSLLGYHKLYHGTSERTAEKVLKEGFDPSFGGTGAGMGNEKFEAQSRGKVHFTKHKPVAEYFAAQTHGRQKNPNAPFTQATGLAPENRGKGKVLHARLSDADYQKMKADPHMMDIKYMGATADFKIGADRVNKSFAHDLAHFGNGRRLVEYIKANPKRFATGAAGGVVGTALAGLGAKGLSDQFLKKED